MNTITSTSEKKRAITGIQPTGKPHLGNYFAAMKPLVSLQEDHTLFVFIADYHALTTVHEPQQLRNHIEGLVLDYLAVGIDPDKVVLYRQSDIPELTELTWIFSNLVTVPWLERAHAFKAKIQQGSEAGVGLFNYPILMAADILLPNAELVPVGKDQIQHIEMTREIARKFNQTYGETFSEPKEMIQEHLATVPGTDGQKMSKSYNNTVPLFGTDTEIKKAIMGIVTDSKGQDEAKDPESCNVFALHKLLTHEPELSALKEQYLKGEIGYGESKKILLANFMKFVTPMRERREYYEHNPGLVRQILDQGARHVQKQSQIMMKEVREKIGL